MKYPIKVKAIKFGDTPVFQPTHYGKDVCGQMVSVRPCADKFENKTYLGIMLGDVALSIWAQFDEKTGTLEVGLTRHNPMIFIPEKNAVVFGIESWWGKIKDEAHLRQITNDDISNVWYVKALKQIGEMP